MSHYTHLSITKREDIMILHKAGHSIGYIASVLNRSKSTISRELKRNSFNTGRGRTYLASTAQKHYKHRRENSVRKKLLNQPELRDLIICLIELHWSPEQIQGRLKLERAKQIISTATIYRAIDQRILITQTPKIPSEDSSQNYDTRVNDDTDKEKKSDVAKYLTHAQL